MNIFILTRLEKFQIKFYEKRYYFVNGGTIAIGNFVGQLNELLIIIGRVVYSLDE